MKDRKQGFLSLIERSKDPIILLDGRTVAEGNKAAVDLFGCRDKDEMVNRRLSDLSPRKQPDGTPSAQKERALITAALNNDSLRFEWTFLKPDGKEFPAEITLSTIRYRSKEFLRAALCALAPAKPVETLSADEHKYRSMFENATEGMFQVRLDGRFLSVNPALARITGYSPEEMLNHSATVTAQAYVTPKRRAEYMTLLKTDGHVSDFECQLFRKDGSTYWGSLSAHAVRDKTGKILCFEGHLQDITQRKLAEEQLILQRDLALELERAASLDEALSLTMRAVTKTACCEFAGIYLRDTANGDLELVASSGLSQDFLKKVARLKSVSEKPLYARIDKERSLPFREALLADGIRSVAIIPILHKGGIIACFNFGSRGTDTLSANSRSTLELVGMQFGNIIARLQAEQELQKDLDRLKQTEEKLEAKTQSLEEVNAALKVLLNGREKDQNELTGKVLSNVEQLIKPYVRKLKESNLDVSQTAWVDIIETNLREVTSPFLRNLNASRFTPRELEIIQLLKEGRSSKEIAELLHITYQGVEIHRHRIRKKLGLNGKKTNLQAYLFSLV